MKKFDRQMTMWLGIAVIVVLAALFAWKKYDKKQQVRPATSAVETLRSAEQLEELLRLATVYGAEGYQNSFIRQILARPSEYGCEQGDRVCAGKQAHLISIEAGLVKYRDGKIEKEVRVSGKGGEYASVLGIENGKNVVYKITLAKAKKNTSLSELNYDFLLPAQSVRLDQAEFCSEIEGCLRPYEYIFVPLGEKGKNDEKDSGIAASRGRNDHSGSTGRYGSNTR